MLIDSAPAEALIATGSPSTSKAQGEDMTGSYAAAGAVGGISFPRSRSEHGVKQPYIKRLRIRSGYMRSSLCMHQLYWMILDG